MKKIQFIMVILSTLMFLFSLTMTLMLKIFSLSSIEFVRNCFIGTIVISLSSLWLYTINLMVVSIKNELK